MRKVNDRDVLREAMSESGMTQAELQELMGYASQGSVSQLLNRKRCSLDKVVAALDKMGYTVVVLRRGSVVFEIKTDWTVNGGDD